MAIATTLLILFVIAFALWYFERALAQKPDRFPGLVMPAAFFILSVVAIVKSAPAVFSQMQESGGGIGGALLSLVLSFVFINLPTLLVYVVYYRTRRKMGERPWPLRPQSDNSKHNKKK